MARAVRVPARCSRHPGPGELVAGAGGLLLLVAMFLPCSGQRAGAGAGLGRGDHGGPGGVERLGGVQRDRRAARLDGGAGDRAAGGGAAVDAAARSWRRRTSVAAALAALLIVYRLIDPPDLPIGDSGDTAYETGRRLGAFFGLLCTAGIAWGAGRAGAEAARASSRGRLGRAPAPRRPPSPPPLRQPAPRRCGRARSAEPAPPARPAARPRAASPAPAAGRRPAAEPATPPAPAPGPGPRPASRRPLPHLAAGRCRPARRLDACRHRRRMPDPLASPRPRAWALATRATSRITPSWPASSARRPATSSRPCRPAGRRPRTRFPTGPGSATTCPRSRARCSGSGCSGSRPAVTPRSPGSGRPSRRSRRPPTTPRRSSSRTSSTRRCSASARARPASTSWSTTRRC